MPALKKPEILSLTSLRFAAALFVFLFHSQIHLGKITSIQSITTMIGQGYVGMSLFFILSGFILSYVYDSSKVAAPKKFYENRFARIYPTYLIYGLITLPHFIGEITEISSIDSLATFPGKSIIQFILILAAFLFMFQGWYPTIFSVWNFGGSWSLSVEAFFYLLFPIIRSVTTKLSKRFLLILMGAGYLWAATPNLYAVFFSQQSIFPVMDRYTYISPIFRLGEFLIGILLYILLVERKVKYFSNTWGLLGFLAVLTMFLVLEPSLPGHVYLSFISIPAFGFLIAWLMENRPRLLETTVLVYLGKISYSFYLAQFFVFISLKSTLLDLEISTPQKWGLAFTITILLAILTYHTIEVPSRKALRKWFEHR